MPRHEVEGSSDADQGCAWKIIAVFVHPDFLFWRADAYEDDVGAGWRIMVWT